MLNIAYTLEIFRKIYNNIYKQRILIKFIGIQYFTMFYMLKNMSLYCILLFLATLGSEKLFNKL